MRPALEGDPSPQQPDLPTHDIIMPPTGIRAGGQETNHQGPLLGGLEGLLRPPANGPAVGRIHENRFTPPILTQPVLGLAEKPGALGVGRRGTGIQGERKLRRERLKQPEWRGPFIRG